MAELGKDTCPHCETDYYPAWTQHDLRIKSPARLEDIDIGSIQVTTCTSCDELIVNLHLKGNDLGKVNRKEGDAQLLPPEADVVIKIIVQIFIDFENLRRREANEPEMTEVEEATMMGSYMNFFWSVWEAAVKYGAGTAQVVEKFRLFFEQIQKLLPPPE